MLAIPISMERIEQVVRSIFRAAPVWVGRVLDGCSTHVYRIGYRNDTFYLRVLPDETASFAPEVAVHAQLRQWACCRARCATTPTTRSRNTSS